MIDERVSLSRWTPPWVVQQHLARYQWAAGSSLGDRVADIACGSGFGTACLSSHARVVYGFDIAFAGLVEARAIFGRTRVLFSAADALALPLGDSSCDTVISFETIEHIPDDRAFLSEIHRVLRPRGRFLCSTPNRQVMNPGRTIRDGSFNPHHVREYDAVEFCDLIGSTFASPRLFGQTIFGQLYVRLLGLVAQAHWLAAARAHQAWKLVRSPFVSARAHVPRPFVEGMRAEVLIASTTKS